MSNSYTYTNSPYQSFYNVDLRAIIFKYFKYWPWFVLSICISLAGAYLYLLYQKPVYSVQARILVADEGSDEKNNKFLKDFGLLEAKKVIDNEIEVLGSLTIMSRAIKKLSLNVVYFKLLGTSTQKEDDAPLIKLTVKQEGPALYGSLLKVVFLDSHTVKINGSTCPLNQDVMTSYGKVNLTVNGPVNKNTEPVIIQIINPSLVARKYCNSLSVIPTSKSSTVLILTLEDTVPDRGEAVLNQLIEEYNQAAIDSKNKVANSTLNFIEKRLNNISKDLALVEKRVELYKSAQGITDLSVQGQSFLQTAQANDAQLNQVTIQLAALNDLQNYMNAQPDKQGAIPATMGLNDPILIGLINKLTQLESQRDQIERTTTDKNPLLQTLNSQIEATKSNISENILTMKKMLVVSRQQCVAKNIKLEGTIRTIPQKERELLDITRQQSIKNELYTYLLQKREETAVSFGAATSNSQVVDAAESSREPIKPVKSTIYALFGLVGLVVPIGVITGRNLLNNRVTRRTDVENTTPIPILGEIVKKRRPGTFIVTHNNLSVAAEQIQMLRANLQFLRKDSTESHVILFTSSISGEGKSFISLNLGASIALVGQPTVILEMDLRRPKLHHLLNVENTIGINEYLKGEVTLNEILRPVPGYPNYYIILCGQLSPNPAILLSSPRVKLLIQELREQFSCILVDSPPSGLVTDAQLIAPLADTTLFVVRHDLTPKNHLKVLNSLYEGQRFKNLNIILNAVGEVDTNYYSYTYKDGYSYNRYSKKI